MAFTSPSQRHELADEISTERLESEAITACYPCGGIVPQLDEDERQIVRQLLVAPRALVAATVNAEHCLWVIFG